MGQVYEYLRTPQTATDKELEDYLVELCLRPRAEVTSDMLSGLADYVLHLQRLGYSIADVRERVERLLKEGTHGK